MLARGYSQTRLGTCGSLVRAMVAVCDDGEMQALICTEYGASGGYMCSACQQVCRTLNATLETCSFAQAARLTPEHFRLSSDARAHLAAALAVLHEAMLDAIFEFESMAAVSEPFVIEGQFDQLIGAYA